MRGERVRVSCNQGVTVFKCYQSLNNIEVWITWRGSFSLSFSRTCRKRETLLLYVRIFGLKVLKLPFLFYFFSSKGTMLFYKPGLLSGGPVEHECNPQRSIGYYLEAVTLLAPFCKKPIRLNLKGVTNDRYDPMVSETPKRGGSYCHSQSSFNCFL